VNAILQQVQQHATALPLALQAELLNYAIYLEKKTRGSALTTSKKCLADWLLAIPNCGFDEDFARVDEPEQVGDVFD